MAAALSVLSVDESTWTVALIGPLTGEDSAFLARHLREITTNAVLDCEHLDDLDAVAASVLLEFREAHRARGFWVFFRGITQRCQARLLESARRRVEATTRRCFDRADAAAIS